MQNSSGIHAEFQWNSRTILVAHRENSSGIEGEFPWHPGRIPVASRENPNPNSNSNSNPDPNSNPNSKSQFQFWGCSKEQGLGLHPVQGWFRDEEQQRRGKKETKTLGFSWCEWISWQSGFSWFFSQLQLLDSLLSGWEQEIIWDPGRIDGQELLNPIPQG